MRWLLLVALFVPAEAHRPGPAERYVVIDKPRVSWVLAGTFETGDEVFTAVLPLKTPIAVPFEMMVPVRDKLENHRPMFAIVGPGLPDPDDATRALLPKEVPDGHGVFLERHEGKREVYFEQVMRRTLWTTGSIAIPMHGAPHEIWIFCPKGTTGDFQLGFGVEEDFSDGGMGALFADWGRYAW